MLQNHFHIGASSLSQVLTTEVPLVHLRQQGSKGTYAY